MNTKNATLIIKVPEGNTRDILVQMVGLIPKDAVAPVRVGAIRLQAGDEYGFEVCPGVSLCVFDAEPLPPAEPEAA